MDDLSHLDEIDSDGQFVPDYSNFPFDLLTANEIAQLMIESEQINDHHFVAACREALKTRKDAGALEGE